MYKFTKTITRLYIDIHDPVRTMTKRERDRLDGLLAPYTIPDYRKYLIEYIESEVTRGRRFLEIDLRGVSHV